MLRWIPIAACLLTMCVVGEAPAAMPCVQEKPTSVVKALPPAFGRGPVWLSINESITWIGLQNSVRGLWIRDRSAPGRAVITGRNRETGARVRFTRSGSILKTKFERFELGRSRTRPPSVSSADMSRFQFDQTDLWFPQPGCYQLTASVGARRYVVVLNVGRMK